MAVWSNANIIEVSASRRIDSEFFHPDYLLAEEKVNASSEIEPLGRLGKFIIGPFGSAFRVSNYDPNSEYRYVRGKDVKPFKLKEDDNVYMPPEDFKRLSKYALEEKDLLISVVGTLGNVAIVPEGTNGIFSNKSTVFRDSKVNPYYLLAYFNSKYGRLCLLRRQRGAVQTGLNKEDLKTVPVPLFDDSFRDQVGGKVVQSLKLIEESKDLYNKAVQLLEEKLGLNEIQLKTSLTYTSAASEVISSRRMNAEYFSPAVKEILTKEFLYDSKPLGMLYQIIRGKSPSEYYDSGIPVVKTKNIRVPEIDRSKISDYVTDTKKLTPIRKDDLLLASMGVGSLGRISFVFGDEGAHVVDGTIRVLRKKSNIQESIEIPTLLFLGTDVGQKLIYRGIVGSTGIISLPDDYLKKIPIPTFKDDLIMQCNSLVIKSMEYKKASLNLLEKLSKKLKN